MGGGFQPVGHVQVLSNLLDFDMDVQQALDCARVFHIDGRLDVERGVRPDVAEGLGQLGHDIATPDMPWGGGQVIHVDWQNGTLAAGSDPRKDGLALAY